MKIRLLLAIAALWANGALAFNPADVEKLRNTGSCPKCDLSKFQFPNKAQLENADLVDADLRDVNLNGVNLTGANLERAKLERANLNGANFSRANLENAKGLKRF